MAEALKIAIVGAGPTGLGAAWRLAELGERDWAIFEQAGEPGGLASSIVDAEGFTWDLGGHVQFSHYPEFDRVMDTLLGPSEWLWQERRAAVWIEGRFVPYPFQKNLRRLPPAIRHRCLAGLARAAFGEAKPVHNFRDWILAQFGEGIAETFMLPYNCKVWAHPPETMSADWVGDRVAPPDFEQALRDVLEDGDNLDWGPNRRFRFPASGGTGAIWRRCAETLPQANVRYGQRIVRVDAKRRRLHTADGSVHKYESLISTAPLTELTEIAGLADLARLLPAKLPHSSTHVVGIGLTGRPPEDVAQKTWMYFPESDCPFYRVTVFSNYAPANVPDPASQWSLLCETSESRYKPVDESAIVAETIAGLERTGLLAGSSRIVSKWQRRLPHGYPVPGLGRDEALHPALEQLESMGVYSRGRFGAWKYEASNQDHSFMQGVEAVNRIVLGEEETTVWRPAEVRSQ